MERQIQNGTMEKAMDCCCLRIQQNCFDTYIFVFYKLLNDAIFVGKSDGKYLVRMAVGRQRNDASQSS